MSVDFFTPLFIPEQMNSREKKNAARKLFEQCVMNRCHARTPTKCDMRTQANEEKKNRNMIVPENRVVILIMQPQFWN